MKFAQMERAALCETLLGLAPNAPTLCEGWSAADLAAHLWVRETDPLAVPGIAVKPLAGLTERRMADAVEKYGYRGLVEKLAHGPSTWSVFAIPGLDEAANAIEYFIHTEDARRANGHDEPRRTDPDFEDFIWRRLSLMARVLFRHVGVGVVLERPDHHDAAIHAQPGAEPVTLLGQPSELMLYAYGRGGVAQVQVVGTDAAIAALHAGNLGV